MPARRLPGLQQEARVLAGNHPAKRDRRVFREPGGSMGRRTGVGLLLLAAPCYL